MSDDYDATPIEVSISYTLPNNHKIVYSQNLDIKRIGYLIKYLDQLNEEFEDVDGDRSIHYTPDEYEDE